MIYDDLFDRFFVLFFSYFLYFPLCLAFKVPSYSLAIRALDSGIPPMSSTVMVNIDISDINDNPPIFSPANLTAVTQVNRHANTFITNTRTQYFTKKTKQKKADKNSVTHCLVGIILTVVLPH